MRGREPFGYVVAIDGPKVTLNLRDAHRGHVAAHREGVSSVTDTGSLFGVDGGTRLLVLRVRSLSFAEPRDAHKQGVGSTALVSEPLRNLEAAIVGSITRRTGHPAFSPDSLLCPSLGAEAYPLSQEELAAILQVNMEDAPRVRLGQDVRGGGNLTVGLSSFLSRHVAVMGGTGQGKSCFTAAVLQQILHLRSPRIVVFDINGEYEQALAAHTSGGAETMVTTLGGSSPTFKIPYYALGRHGLGRLLLPSEKTQRPALNFALENLQYVEWSSQEGGAGLSGEGSVLYDDGRPGPAGDAGAVISRLRERRDVTTAAAWPHMLALGCLVADSHCITRNSRGELVRAAFEYGNVAPLITRIRRCVEDPLFTAVVDVNGGQPSSSDGPDWHSESSNLVNKVFGTFSAGWKLHVVNLRNVAHDLLPMVLGSLLELLAFEMFRRGQGGTYPTLLVLEEAHHYLRQLTGGEEGIGHSLAYERLAKEGRKFGVALWLSTQRPAEISPTVLAQCGTWAVFRLTSEQDLRAVGAAGEWLDRRDIDRISGLPRQQALVFGGSVAVPTRITAPTADPVPKSSDPDFSCWQTGRTVRRVRRRREN